MDRIIDHLKLTFVAEKPPASRSYQEIIITSNRGRLTQEHRQRKGVDYFLLRAFLRQHLSEAGIGSVSEVFDGDAPHRPGGCIAQAWSVAELIRLYTMIREG